MVNIEKENKKEFNNILYCKKCATKGNSGGYAGSTCNWYRCSKCGSYIFPLDKCEIS